MAERWVVREARRAEAPAIIEMYRWLFAPPGAEPVGWEPEEGERRLLLATDDPEAIVLVAEAGDASPDAGLFGLCTAYIDIHSVRFGTRCWVEDLAVDPARRSVGVGAKLLAAARQWARGRGATHLELDSAQSRPDAHRFYEREGGEGPSYSYGWRLT